MIHAPPPARGDRDMLVATYNVHRGRPPAGLFRPEGIARVIAEIRPDLIALQEAQHYLRPDAPMLDEELLAREAGLRPLRLPDRPREQGWRSNIVLVRRDATVLRPPVGLRIGGMEPRGAIMAELDLGWGPFRLIATHLSLGAARRVRQGQALLAAMEAGAGAGLPTVLVGDFNEWRAGGSVLGVLRPAFGTPPAVATFPAFRPFLALDRIMTHPAGLAAAVAAHDTPLARRASDHLPLTARVSLRGR
ncbi:EEP domain-containing protein [Roseomonas nepalensis]|uniref:EEP domain-containing protein n=1 Tax=Muricoccus nepalensis TaxID=1854500 RepID=A0A502GCN2_9PROT|nr:endonuclease/exonuclease/phosphatase family protein [Roseomonas nepalensis]TPG59614.1 EEP domain-containing protein [Roseomonas nepalensis]